MPSSRAIVAGPLMTESECRWCTTSCTSLTADAQLRFHLLEPVGHAHFAVHRRRDNEVLPSLTGIAHAVMHFAETEVAVGNEWTHAARLSERQRLAVIAFSVLGAGCGGDVTVEAEGMGLVAPSPKPGERQGPLGVAGSLVDPFF